MAVPGLTWALLFPHTRQCEASPTDITCSGASLYCLGDEYMTQGKRTLTGPGCSQRSVIVMTFWYVKSERT